MSRITAIIVDDVAQLRQLLRSVLKRYDCDVVAEFGDGNGVLAATEETKPDIVFLDLDMPNTSGQSVLASFAALAHHPYTVVVSGDSRRQTRDLVLDAGAHAFITKPFTSQNVGAVVEAFNVSKEAAQSYTALIADDENIMRDLLSNVLKKQNCTVVHAAANGQEALSYLVNNPAPDIVFLDIDMPVLDGLSTLKKIREISASQFCAMVSAHSSFANVKLAMDQGSNGFIVKPYQDEKIRQVLKQFRAKQAKG